MKKLVSSLFWLALLLVAIAGMLFSGDSSRGFRKDTLAIEVSGKTHPFRIELAETPAQLERGLMRRTEIASDEGMLFLFPPEHVPHMWMKDTLLPLDMLFADNDGKIIHIAEDAKPGSLEIISPNRYVRAVLEVPAGTARALRIRTGDRLVHPAFTQEKDKKP
jgi:uncharacterized protein